MIRNSNNFDSFRDCSSSLCFCCTESRFCIYSKSGEVLKAGLEEATSSVELAGSVVALGGKTNDNKMKVSNITFYIKTAVGKRPVDLSNNTLVISYMDPYKVVDRLKYGEEVEVEEIQGDGDQVIEYGELFKITIRLDKIYGNLDSVQLKPNDTFIVEVKPLVGAVLKVERRIPPAIDPVMDLT